MLFFSFIVADTKFANNKLAKWCKATCNKFGVERSAALIHFLSVSFSLSEECSSLVEKTLLILGGAQLTLKLS